MSLVRIAWRNLLRNPRRAALTTASIGASLLVFCGLNCFPYAARKALQESRTSVRIECHHRAGLTYSLPESYKRAIASLPRIQAVAAQSWFGGIYLSKRPLFTSVAVDPG